MSHSASSVIDTRVCRCSWTNDESLGLFFLNKTHLCNMWLCRKKKCKYKYKGTVIFGTNYVQELTVLFWCIGRAYIIVFFFFLFFFFSFYSREIHFENNIDKSTNFLKKKPKIRFLRTITFSFNTDTDWIQSWNKEMWLHFSYSFFPIF